MERDTYILFFPKKQSKNSSKELTAIHSKNQLNTAPEDDL